MSLEIHDSPPFGHAIQPLLTAPPAEERREEGLGIRYPFFRTVSITTHKGECQEAFCRDISADGIGLLHRIALAPGEIAIAFTAEDECVTTFKVRIVWCSPYDEGWHISGGQFVSTPGFGKL
jgi:hypothetical protein